jgi:hypothetical protein
MADFLLIYTLDFNALQFSSGTNSYAFVFAGTTAVSNFPNST